MRKGSILEKNEKGLYDLRIHDENGVPIVDVKNITFQRAVCIIEDNMYCYHAQTN